MNLIIMFTLLILCSAAVAKAEIYTWTDDQGTVTFTDNPARLPSHYGSSVQMEENAIIRMVQKKSGSRTTLQATIPRNRIKATIAGVKQTTSPQEVRQSPKGQRGGDQAVPSPPGMKQPTPAPSGAQPTEAQPGKNQAMPVPPPGDPPRPAAN